VRKEARSPEEDDGCVLGLNLLEVRVRECCVRAEPPTPSLRQDDFRRMLTQPRESKAQRGLDSQPKEKERSAEEEERRAKKQFFKRVCLLLPRPNPHPCAAE
jgi:hypothetical protein